jgi:cytochrome P450
VNATNPVSDLFDAKPHMARCPYPAYRQLRGEAPLRWIDRIQAYAVTRYSDIVAILRAPEKFSSAMASGPGSVTPLARRLVQDPQVSAGLRAKAARRLEISKSAVLLFADPPDHIRQRKLVNKAFTARRILAMEPAVEKLANDLLDAFIGDGRAEMVSQFSILMPMTVIADILGVPADLHATFKRWSDAFVAGTGSMRLTDDQVAEIFTAVGEFYDYFTARIAQRREHPGDDLLSAIVTARIGGATPLSQNEMLQMLVQFLVAGNETTTNLLTSVMYRLVTEPELMRSVRADRSLVPKLVEEVLRLESPVQGLFRTATDDVEIGGFKVPKGANLYLVYGSANRDGATFSEPDELKLDRPAEGNHLAFGQGEHFCLGAPIARLETRVGISSWLERTTDIVLDQDPDNIQYLPSFAQHGIKQLPLRFTSS